VKKVGSLTVVSVNFDLLKRSSVDGDVIKEDVVSISKVEATLVVKASIKGR
jgi:hypothetical protein